MYECSYALFNGKKIHSLLHKGFYTNRHTHDEICRQRKNPGDMEILEFAGSNVVASHTI